MQETKSSYPEYSRLDLGLACMALFSLFVPEIATTFLLILLVKMLIKHLVVSGDDVDFWQTWGK